MSHNLLTKWLAPRQSQKCQDRSGLPATSSRRYRPHLERLESRIVPVIITPFTPRFSANAAGAIASIANTPETASTVNNPGPTQQDVSDAQNGVGPNTDNHVARSEFKKSWFYA